MGRYTCFTMDVERAEERLEGPDLPSLLFGIANAAVTGQWICLLDMLTVSGYSQQVLLSGEGVRI